MNGETPRGPAPVFQGLSAFPITPSDADGRVDVDAVRRLVARLLEARVDSIGLLGSTGTYAYLSRAERRRTIEAAYAATQGQTPLIVGIGALRTDDAVRLGKEAREAGADAALLAPVSYTPLTDEEVFIHFETVAGNVGLPICVYNNPGTTHFTFSGELIARLSRVANIVAIKNPAPARAEVAEHLHALRGRVKEGFSLGYSVDWNASEALLAGGDAWYSVLAGLFPQPCRRLVDAVRDRRGEDARRLDAELQPIWDLFRRLSSLRVMYAAASLIGISYARPPRPILPLPASELPAVQAALKAAQLDR